MTRFQRIRQCSVAATTLWLAGLCGCQQAPVRPPSPLVFLPGAEQESKLSARQAADVQVALGRSLELRGETEQAMVVYREALKRDPTRADAYLRLAILSDQQGKFDESAGFYRKALTVQPGNAEVYCDMGYSLSLQRRWAEAEMNLRQALALAQDHRRAHNNLGLVFAHSERWDEALAEFRKGGCDEAEAHINLAFVLTLEHCWPEARTHYQRALALQPKSTAAREGLAQLKSLVAKAGPADDALALGGRWRRVRGNAPEEPLPSVAAVAQVELPPKVPEAAFPPPAVSVLPEAPASWPEARTEKGPNTIQPATYTVADTARPEPRVDTARAKPIPSGAGRGKVLPTEQLLPPVVSPLTHLEHQVKELCGTSGTNVEVRAESATSLRIGITVRCAEEGYKLASKVLWMPELGPYQVALDIKVVE